MVDTCAPHPWARAQSQPPRGEKIKSILLLFTLCDLFAHRHTLDIYTTQTRTSSVIYAPFADQTKMHKTEKQHHNTIFFNTTAWGSHPYASPEGPRTTPSKKRQRWATVGPLGAAMRLTALRQPPKDVSGPKNPRHMKRKSIPTDLHTSPLCYCKHTSPESKKCRRAGQHAASQGGAEHATHSTDISIPVPELTKRKSGTRRNHLYPNLAPNKTSTRYQCLHAHNTRQEPLARRGMATRCNLNTEGGRTHGLTPQRTGNTRLPCQ